MIAYKRCSEVNMESIYNAFLKGFSDYIIKFEMTFEHFTQRFLGPEGNQLEHSFIALVDEAPVGLMLGGIRDYEGRKTLRCGAMCIHPDFRKQQIGQGLFELHLKEAKNHHCNQLFLEVIVGNDRAIRFYEKMGYEKVYDLKYFTCNDLSSIKNKSMNHEISLISLEQLAVVINQNREFHINWQNDIDYIKQLEGIYHFGIYHEKELVGSLSMAATGKIYLLWINPTFRGRGFAIGLIKHGAETLDLKKLTASFPNHSAIEGLYRSLGFTKDSIAQYEMYLYL